MSKTAQKLSQADEAVLKHVDPKMREEVARKRRDSRNGVYLASMARKKKNLPNLSVENKAFFTDKFHVAQKESAKGVFTTPNHSQERGGALQKILQKARRQDKIG